MSGTCDEVEQMLAWIANGTATADEQGRVYRHTVHCAACRRDLARTLALQHRVEQSLRALPAPPLRMLPGLCLPKPNARAAGRSRARAALFPLLSRSGFPSGLGEIVTRLLALAGERPSVWVSVPLPLAARRE